MATMMTSPRSKQQLPNQQRGVSNGMMMDIVGSPARPSPHTRLRSTAPTPPPPTAAARASPSSSSSSSYGPSFASPPLVASPRHDHPAVTPSSSMTPSSISHIPRAPSSSSSSRTPWRQNVMDFTSFLPVSSTASSSSAPVSRSSSPSPTPLVPLVPRLVLPSNTSAHRPAFQVSSARISSATATRPSYDHHSVISPRSLSPATLGMVTPSSSSSSTTPSHQQHHAPTGRASSARQRTPATARPALYQRRTVAEAVAASESLHIRPQTAAATAGARSNDWLHSLRTAPSRTARRRYAAQLLQGTDAPPVGDELLPLPTTATRAILTPGDLDSAAMLHPVTPSVARRLIPPRTPVPSTPSLRHHHFPAHHQPSLQQRLYRSAVPLTPSSPTRSAPSSSSATATATSSMPTPVSPPSGTLTISVTSGTGIVTPVIAVPSAESPPSGPSSPMMFIFLSDAPSVPPSSHQFMRPSLPSSPSPSSSPIPRHTSATPSSSGATTQRSTRVAAEVTNDEAKEEAAVDAALRPLADALSSSKIGGLRRARLLSAERRRIKAKEKHTATTVKLLTARHAPPVDVYGIEVEDKKKQRREDHVYQGQMKWRRDYQHELDGIFDQLHFEAEWERYTGRIHRQVEGKHLYDTEQSATHRLFEARELAMKHALEERHRHQIRLRFRETVWAALAASRLERAITTRTSHRNAIQIAARIKVAQLAAARHKRERAEQEHQLRLRIMDKQRAVQEYWSGVEHAIAKRRHDLEEQRRQRNAKMQHRRELDGMSTREKWRLNAERGWLRVHISRAQDITGISHDVLPRIQLQLRYANPTLPTRTQYSTHFHPTDTSPTFDTDFSFRVSHAHLQQLSIAIQLPSKSLVAHWEAAVERKHGWAAQRPHKSSSASTPHGGLHPAPSPHGHASSPNGHHKSTTADDDDHDDDHGNGSGHSGDIAVIGEVVLRLRDLRKRARGEFAAALQLADVPGILHIHIRLIPLTEGNTHGSAGNGNGGVADKQTASSIARSPPH